VRVSPADDREERNGRALARELTRLRTFEEAVAVALGTPVAKPGSGTREMVARLELAVGVLTGARVDRNPIVLRAAADAVQLRALAAEGQKLRADDEIEAFGMGDSTFLARVASELRSVERELREEAKAST
jgi:hypothetical protein